MNSGDFLTLKDWQKVLGNRIPASTLRAEVLAGNIKGLRARPSCNAPILISEKEMKRWLEDVAGKRVAVLSPCQTSKILRAEDSDNDKPSSDKTNDSGRVI